MNDENLKSNKSRTKEELREMGRKGGKKSGAVRRRKADFKKALNNLLTRRIYTPDAEELEALGIEGTFENVLLARQITSAMNGDTNAAYFVAKYSGQSGNTALDDQEQKARIANLKKIDDSLERQEECIRRINEAMRPSNEELKRLFGEENVIDE